MNFKEIANHVNRVNELRRTVKEVDSYLNLVGRRPTEGYLFYNGKQYHYWEPEEVKELIEIKNKDEEELRKLESMEFYTKENQINLSDVCNMVSYWDTFAPYTVKTLAGILREANEWQRSFHHYGKFMSGEKEFLIQNGFTIEDLPSENLDYPEHNISWDRTGDERYRKKVTELIGWEPYFVDPEWLERFSKGE